MRNKIDNNVDQIPGSENVKINSRAARRSQRSDHSESAGSKMTEVHNARHVEETEHQPVGVHDSGNVVEEINAEEQRGKSPCALLDRRYWFRHSGLSENLGMSIVTLYFAGKQLLPLTYAKDNVSFPQTTLA